MGKRNRKGNKGGVRVLAGAAAASVAAAAAKRARQEAIERGEEVSPEPEKEKVVRKKPTNNDLGLSLMNFGSSYSESRSTRTSMRKRALLEDGGGGYFDYNEDDRYNEDAVGTGAGGTGGESEWMEVEGETDFLSKIEDDDCKLLDYEIPLPLNLTPQDVLIEDQTYHFEPDFIRVARLAAKYNQELLLNRMSRGTGVIYLDPFTNSLQVIPSFSVHGFQYPTKTLPSSPSSPPSPSPLPSSSSSSSTQLSSNLSSTYSNDDPSSTIPTTSASTSTLTPTPAAAIDASSFSSPSTSGASVPTSTPSNTDPKKRVRLKENFESKKGPTSPPSSTPKRPSTSTSSPTISSPKSPFLSTKSIGQGRRKCATCGGLSGAHRVISLVIPPSKTPIPLTFLKCSSCDSSHHPDCLDLLDHTLIQILKDDSSSSTWLCPSCKTCERCGSAGDEDRFLMCDSCDKGYHTFCLKPPLQSLPDGAWTCPLCSPTSSTSSGSTPSTSSTPSTPSSASRSKRRRR